MATSAELDLFDAFGKNAVVFSQGRGKHIEQDNFICESNHDVEPAGVESNRAGFFARVELLLDFKGFGGIVVNMDPTLGCCGDQLLTHAHVHARNCS